MLVSVVGSVAVGWWGSPGEVDAFLGHLAGPVLGVRVRLVTEHLHPLSSPALLTAVFADHIQLTDLILKER